uniref:Lactamase_B domain-containing protein n=1 Tax=Heterorhabditis bacteriophora TaxID=37862 RepID=A0A1I7X5Z7_HETBA
MAKYLGHVVEEWSDACLLNGVQASGGRAVFDESAAMYRHVWSQLADDVVASMRVLTTDFAREYQQNRWCTMTSRLGTLDRELSILFCPLLMNIRSTFANAGKMISQASLPALFKRMTSALAHIILEDVVNITSFNAEGASQMLYDMENGLFPVCLFNSSMKITCKIKVSNKYSVLLICFSDDDGCYWVSDFIIYVVGRCHPLERRNRKEMGVTFIKTVDNENILVDCGDPWNSLQITLLVITHGHLDHCGNLGLFKNAKIFMATDYAINGEYGSIDKINSHKLCTNVELLMMKGHTDSDLVVIVKNTKKGCIVIAGDLFESEYDENIWRSSSRYPSNQVESRQRIRNCADWIVPGHGVMFENKMNKS